MHEPILRVLHLRSSRGYGGPESALRYLLPALADLGVSAGLVVSHRPGLSALGWHRSLPGRYWDIEDRGRFDRSLFTAVSEIVMTFTPDLLHCHDYKSNILGLRAKRRYHVPAVATLHGYTGGTRFLRVYERFDRVVVVPRFDRVISPMPAGDGQHTIFNGIDPDEVRQRSEPAAEWASPDECRLVSIGRVSREKGLDVLVSALAGLSDSVPWRLAVIGDGPSLPQLRRQVEEAQVSHRVLFAGFQENPLPMLAAADALVLPSHRERCPLVVLEAMALGKVVLASRVGALPDLVDQNQTGWLVPAADQAAWLKALSVAWQERGRWREMGQLARDRVHTMFHIAHTARQHLELYRSVVSGRGNSEG